MFSAFNFTWPKVVVGIFDFASVATFSPEMTAPGMCMHPTELSRTRNVHFITAFIARTLSLQRHAFELLDLTSFCVAFDRRRRSGV